MQTPQLLVNRKQSYQLLNYHKWRRQQLKWEPLLLSHSQPWANIEFRVPYSERYLVLGLVGLGLPLLLRLGLALWLVSGIALNKYRCEYGTLNSMFAQLWPSIIVPLLGLFNYPTQTTHKAS